MSSFTAIDNKADLTHGRSADITNMSDPYIEAKKDIQNEFKR